MRKVIFAINMTLDGCVDHAPQFVDDEKMDFFTEFTRAGDTQVFGRKTYELMVPYWPEVLKDSAASRADTEFARAFEALKKVVFSRTLASGDDGNTRIVGTDLRAEILRLKQEPGKNILVGGVDIPTQMMKLELIDEYLLVVGPVFAGGGRRLMDGVSLAKQIQLKLVETKSFKSGSVALRYAK